MMRVMLDTNEYDRLLGDTATCERLFQFVKEGKVELLTTHIQKDEIEAISIKQAKKTIGAAFDCSTYPDSWNNLWLVKIWPSTFRQ